jgi:Domain of unknown function (DUF4397)
MHFLNKLGWTGLSLLAIAGCGSDGDSKDTQDRFDVADPAVRFVHASPVAPNVTLYRNGTAQSDATNVAYKFASNYFDVETNASLWVIKTAVGDVEIGGASIDAKRGNKYTLVVLPSSSTANSVYEIRDPYNKSLTSDKAKLRIMNASFNADNIDLYINQPGTDVSLAGIAPVIAGTAYKTAGPTSGNDSFNIDGGSYQMTITLGGSKTVLFKGPITIENNKDILLLTVPSSILPGAIKTLIKIEGVAGTTELPSS